MSFKFSLKPGLLFLLVVISVLSCKNDSELEDNIARINTDIQIERFDKLFSEVTSENLPNLKTAYPFMFSEKYQDSFWIDKKSDTLQVQLFHEVDKAFSNISDTELEIESLFNHLIYYFPQFSVPRVITVTNDVDYRNKVIVTDSIVVVALDTYLGRNHDFYGAIPKYLRENLTKEQLVVDLAGAYAEKHTYHPQRKTLLDEMVYYGKLLYFKQLVIPFKTEAELIGYTDDDLDWSIANESYIWRYLIERELLYSTDSKLPGRFINPAPFSKFFLEEIDTNSPGRLGQYIGWQIIKAYMENNDVNLNAMLIANTEDIFNNSKFKPRK